MSRLWRRRLRAALCPDRLVFEHEVVPLREDPLGELARRSAGRKLTLVLSNRYLRYAILPWTQTLRTEDEWLAYARHVFASTCGPQSSSWEIRICDTGRKAARLACAFDAALLLALRAVEGLASVQPYLMWAFNARRAAFDGEPAWFVLQEPGRLLIGLIAYGQWRSVRARQIDPHWREALPLLLDREAYMAGVPAGGRVLICAEDDVPTRAGGYDLIDITLPSGAKGMDRTHAMVCA